MVLSFLWLQLSAWHSSLKMLLKKFKKNNNKKPQTLMNGWVAHAPGAIQYCGIGLPKHQVSSTIMFLRDAGIPFPFRKVGLGDNLMEDHTKELPETACFSKWQQSKVQKKLSTYKQQTSFFYLVPPSQSLLFKCQIPTFFFCPVVYPLTPSYFCTVQFTR